MVYIDASVILAELLAEDRRPPKSIWNHDLYSSRLLEYEVWNRMHAYGLAKSHERGIQNQLNIISYVELSPIVLKRAKESFSIKLRTLDALHFSTFEYLLNQGVKIQLAAYDDQMLKYAKKTKIPLYKL
jgi:predicted nucleic acid-binding protein